MLAKYFDNKGMALPAVIMVMVVLSILGASILSVALSENKFAIDHTKDTEAYCVSKSGLEAAATYFVVNPMVAASAATSGSAFIGNSGTGSFSVTVASYGTDMFKLQSIGTVGTKDESTYVLLKKVPGGAIVADSIDIEKYDNSQPPVEITYDTYYDPPQPLDPNVTATQREIDLAPFTIPSVVNFNVNINKTDNNHVITFKKNPNPADTYQYAPGKYNNLISAVKGEIIFDTTGYTMENPMVVVLDNIDYNDLDLTVVGTGAVNFYVRDKYEVKNNSNVVVDNGVTPSPDQFILFLGDYDSTPPLDGYLYMKNNGGFEGYIYGPNATILIDNNSAFYGAVLADTVDINNNALVIFVEPSNELIANALTLGLERNKYTDN